MMSNKMRYLIFYPPGRSVMSENFRKTLQVRQGDKAWFEYDFTAP